VGQSFTGKANIKGKCCKDVASCAEIKLDGYICSDGYTDVNLAKVMCPRDNNTCGQADKFDMNDASASGAASIKGMEPGETCNFKIRSTCGAPGFSLDSSTKVAPRVSFVTVNNDVLDADDKKANDDDIAKGGKGKDGSRGKCAVPPVDPALQAKDPKKWFDRCPLGKKAKVGKTGDNTTPVQTGNYDMSQKGGWMVMGNG
jgi:hypothetical protein